MPALSRFSDFRIKNKLLLVYSVLFFLAFSLAGGIIYIFVKSHIQAGIETELKSSSQTLLSIVSNSADVSIKHHLRAVAEKNREITAHFHALSQQGQISEDEAKQRAKRIFEAQTIGTTGYVYCLNSQGTIVMHPHEALLGADLTAHAFIREQLRRRQGYLEYDWKNPGEEETRPKALYMTAFEPWDWIISASSYREEFNQLVNARDLEESILSLRFGQSGYSFVLDTRGNLVIHPALEGRNIFEVTPAESRDSLKRLVREESGTIVYPWRNPGEDELRKKMVIFHAIPEFGWVVASSIYLDEFYGPLNTVGHIIAITMGIVLVLVILVTSSISSTITNPLQELMAQFHRGTRGDDSVRMKPRSRDEVGLLSEYFNTFMDHVSASRQTERDMARIRLFLQHIVDAMPSLLVSVDHESRITLWNQEATRLTGIQAEQARGKVLPRELPQLQPHMDLLETALERNLTMTREKVTFSFLERERTMDIMVYPVVFDNTAGGVIRLDDVTSRVRMEEIMVQTEKMMSVGGLAAGMAHEINNPLGGILQNVQNLTRRLSGSLPGNQAAADRLQIDLDAVTAYLEQRKIFHFLNQIKESGERASRIVDNMLTFSRKSRSQKLPLNLADVINKTIELAAHDYDLKKHYDFRNIQILRYFDEDLPEVMCVGTEMEQVVLNLLRNAAQALAEGRLGGTRSRIVLRLYQQDHWAVIEVEDNGPGMDEDTRKRVFEPFFSTKGVGLGTGLGLSVAYFIVTNNHNGSMRVESARGSGTRFVISLPVSRYEFVGL
jgi:PAS domain S-box-containing protein